VNSKELLRVVDDTLSPSVCVRTELFQDSNIFRSKSRTLDQVRGGKPQRYLYAASARRLPGHSVQVPLKFSIWCST